MSYDDHEDRTELAGRIVTGDGRIAAFVTLSAGNPDTNPDEILQRAERAIAAEFDEDDLRLIDGHGEEVSADA